MNLRQVPFAIAAVIAASACSPAQQGPASDAKGNSADQTTHVQLNDSAGMHDGMVMENTGDPDADFLRAMIPHHQSAIDMARIELERGRDPAVRALAQRVIDAQQAEIDQMRDWLKKRAKAPERERSPS